MTALLAGATLLHATENGATTFPNGAEDFLTADMPPPGFYGWITYNRYTADRFAGDSGQSLLPGFDFAVSAVVPRFDWVKPVHFLGADRWGTLFIVPALDLDLAFEPSPGARIHGSARGLGDLTIGNGLHWTLPHFSMVNAVDVVFPTGEYDATQLVQPGQNHWAVRLSHLGTWHPTDTWDVSYRVNWDYNLENHATSYRSGQTLYLNWGVGWKPTPPLTVGVAGYFLRQITDDEQHGHSVAPSGNRRRTDGIGPALKYFLPNHSVLTLKFFHEFSAHNGPQGEQVWIQFATPLGH